MISCTEFIPMYSEFFKFLEKQGGYDEVLKYWYHISDTSLGDETNPHSMVSFIKQYGGFDGARKYWGHTTTEEACDIYAVLDPVQRYSYSHMRYCPSRGMLNNMKHLEPYHNYCEHCKIIYSRVLEKYGVTYERDHSMVHNAECTSLLYETGNRPTGDYTQPGGSRIVSDVKREGAKYLHRDFHLLGDNALKYCADTYGEEQVPAFMKDFTVAYYSPLIGEIKEGGLTVLKNWIESIYEKEEASDVLHTELKEGTLTVKIDYCPVIKYMRSLNQEPSKYYIEETRTHYAALAEASGLDFVLDYYNEDGGTQFRFSLR